jgi:hypothetical protein
MADEDNRETTGNCTWSRARVVILGGTDHIVRFADLRRIRFAFSCTYISCLVRFVMANKKEDLMATPKDLL